MLASDTLQRCAPHCPPWTPDHQALGKVTQIQAPILWGSNPSGVSPEPGHWTQARLCTPSSLWPPTTVDLGWVGKVNQAIIAFVPSLRPLEPSNQTTCTELWSLSPLSPTPYSPLCARACGLGILGGPCSFTLLNITWSDWPGAPTLFG